MKKILLAISLAAVCGCTSTKVFNDIDIISDAGCNFDSVSVDRRGKDRVKTVVNCK
jgi:hypothetical protein